MTLRIRVAAAAVAITAALAAAGVAGAMHRGGAVKLTPAEKRAQRYVERATLKALNGPDCQPRQHRAAYPGRPPRDIRAVLGVLRGAPTHRSASALREIVGGRVGVYVNYVRLARVVDGVSYYVYVSDGSPGGFPPANVSRCLSAERAAFMAALPSIPAALQQSAKRVFALDLAADRRADRQPVRENVTVTSRSVGGGGSGVSGATAQQIRDQGMYAATCCSHGTVLYGVVPNGVATVSFVYPRKRSTDPDRRLLPQTVRTARVVNNVVVTPTPRGPTAAFKQIWRTPGGHVVRVVPSPPNA